MNKFNRSRKHRESNKSYKMGDLVTYHYSASGMESCDLLAIITGFCIGRDYIQIRFLEDGSCMTCSDCEISEVNETWF